jgi:hypothetical protein
MREHGTRRIWTRDTDFNQFPFLEVIDPLRPYLRADNYSEEKGLIRTCTHKSRQFGNR